ncbi:MAG: nicotinate phosphoribosyltransferase [Actinobacteria bacterium HGW-Actinobacteria-1]|jgi:nicotinate phosphoribosyltransferase|nr:MAG: nicotinate phosphoribosyltransferase [Actinobacteria bacterium HGW-Actinobacteria-1]
MDARSGVPVMLTDLYQLTMAYAYWRSGIAETEACFHASFRRTPFGGGYAVAAGLEQVVEYLTGIRFSEQDVAYLGTLTGNDGAPLFTPEFLDWLLAFKFTCDVDAMLEGTVVFPREPLVRVIGPIMQCQIVETALLNIVNFQTLVATKAARVCSAAQGDPVLEFGLRRAQGPDGGLSASRASYVGGCSGTSNVLAGQRYGIPVGGTHAHSWVMAFDTELEAFLAYADAMPNNATFLVDTYDTLDGVRHAIAAGRRLAERGYSMIGIRIDSGDLAWLSRRAREILDAAGFQHVKIYASNELDESLIESLKDQGAAIDVWGVGTRLVTADGQPSLGGVYKLSAVREAGRTWEPRIKVSEQTAKVTMPGVLQVRRFTRDGRFDGDMIYNEAESPGEECTMVDPEDATRRKAFCGEPFENLLLPILRGGAQVMDMPAIATSRDRTVEQLAMLDPSVKRFLNPHGYPVGVELRLHELRTRLILKARGLESAEGGVL